MNKEYLQKCAEEVSARLPDNHGFVLLTMLFNTPDARMGYVSNCNREDAIAVVKEWLIQANGEEEWMKHIK